MQGSPVSVMARRFHASLSAGLVSLCRHFSEKKEVRHIGLSGGSLQNMTLSCLLEKGLKEAGLVPLTHTSLPPGDACISLGQAAWGRYVLAGEDKEMPLTGLESTA